MNIFPFTSSYKEPVKMRASVAEGLRGPSSSSGVRYLKRRARVFLLAVTSVQTWG